MSCGICVEWIGDAKDQRGRTVWELTSLFPYVSAWKLLCGGRFVVSRLKPILLFGGLFVCLSLQNWIVMYSLLISAVLVSIFCFLVLKLF